MKSKLFFILAIMLSMAGAAAARVVHGTVLDAADNEPIIGASVIVKGESNGVATDANGQFAINVPEEGAKLLISYVGMTTQEANAQEGMVVMLKASTSSLDEVVVVAYGTQKRSSITGAISQVGAKDIENRPVSSVTSALEGTSSGITITGSYGQPGTEPDIRIRGIGTVNGSSSPLYVVDGVPYGGDITDLNPEDIESMSVLKDAASCALYGNRASNGVILITTKKSKVQKPSFIFKTNQGFYRRGIPEYERVSVAQFMGIEYENMLNGYIHSQGLDRTSSADMQAARDYVAANIVANRLITNPFNAPATALYDANGQLASGVGLLGQYAEDLDWFGQGIRTGYRSEYIFSGSGGTDYSDYYFSIGYLDENGYMKGSGFERLSGRAVVNINPRDWFKSGLSVSATHQKVHNSAGDVDGSNSATYSNPFYYSRMISPIYPVHLHDPATGQYMLDFLGNRRYDPGFYDVTAPDGTVQEVATRDQLANNHPIWEAEVNTDKYTRNTMDAMAYADAILPAGFIFTLKGNLNTSNQDRAKYNSSLIGSGAKGGDDSGALAKVMYTRKHWTFQQQLHWNRKFSQLSINALLGHENYSYSQDYTYVYKKGIKVEGQASLNNFNTQSDADGYRTRYRTESYLGRVQFNWDNRYNLEGSFRRDGSSRFDKDSRWGNFGSVGANWVFSNEDFCKSSTWLTSGKLRANWGQVGNDAGSAYYAYYALYDTETKGGQAAYVVSQLPARDLKWETGESWGIAIETRLWDRWNLSVEYYDKRNKDLIFDVYNPISAGGTSTSAPESTITRNLGTIANRGWEINTDITIFANKDWTVNLAANLTTLTNKVLKLPEQNKDGILSGSYKVVEGRSRYEWFTYHWAGTDMLDGQSLYDANLDDYHIEAPDGSVIGGTYGDDGVLTSTAIKDTDYKLIGGKYYVNNTTMAKKDFRGSTLPKVYGSFTPSVSFKGFNLSALFTYSLGGKVLDSSYLSLMSTSDKNPHHYHVDILNSWSGAPAGMTEASADRINPGINPEIWASSSYNNAVSDRWLISRNYLCLKNLSLSYRLPAHLVRACDLSGILLSFSAENVFTSTKRKGLHVQQSLAGGISNSIPPARIFTFGLTVNI